MKIAIYNWEKITTVSIDGFNAVVDSFNLFTSVPGYVGVPHTLIYPMSKEINLHKSIKSRITNFEAYCSISSKWQSSCSAFNLVTNAMVTKRVGISIVVKLS